MTKKELQKIEEVVERILEDMLNQEEMTLEGHDEAGFPLSVIRDMEDYLGEEITFMGIS